MGIYITPGIVFALFIGAAYIAARLQDKLQTWPFEEDDEDLIAFAKYFFELGMQQKGE